MGADDLGGTVELHGPVDPTRARCGVCGTIGIGFVADVRYFPGDGFAIGRPLLLCTRCRTLIATGNRFVLTSVITPELAERGRERVVTYLLHRVNRVMPAVAPPPELAALRADGFDLLDSFTGAVDEVAVAWPEDHRRTLADPYRDMSTQGTVWLVRSPWPSLTVGDVLELLWPWVERGGSDPEARRNRLAQVFAWDEAHATAWLDLCRNP